MWICGEQFVEVAKSLHIFTGCEPATICKPLATMETLTTSLKGFSYDQFSTVTTINDPLLPKSSFRFTIGGLHASGNHANHVATNELQGYCKHKGSVHTPQLTDWSLITSLSLSMVICLDCWAEHVCYVCSCRRAAGDAGKDWHLQTAGGEDLRPGGLLVSMCGLEHHGNPEEPKGICAHRMWVHLDFLLSTMNNGYVHFIVQHFSSKYYLYA